MAGEQAPVCTIVPGQLSAPQWLVFAAPGRPGLASRPVIRLLSIGGLWQGSQGLVRAIATGSLRGREGARRQVGRLAKSLHVLPELETPTFEDLTAWLEHNLAEIGIPETGLGKARLALRARYDELLEDGSFSMDRLAQVLVGILGSLSLDFIFRNPAGAELDRARNPKELEQALARVPAESLVFHATNNHFSTWLMMRGEFELAARLESSKLSDFPSAESFRLYLIETLRKHRAG